jgi:hypothetical protein
MTSLIASRRHGEVNAVNHLAQHGTWHYLLVTDPGTVGKAPNSYTTAKWDEGQFELRWPQDGWPLGSFA